MFYLKLQSCRELRSLSARLLDTELPLGNLRAVDPVLELEIDRYQMDRISGYKIYSLVLCRIPAF